GAGAVLGVPLLADEAGAGAAALGADGVGVVGGRGGADPVVRLLRVGHPAPAHGVETGRVAGGAAAAPDRVGRGSGFKHPRAFGRAGNGIAISVMPLASWRSLTTEQVLEGAARGPDAWPCVDVTNGPRREAKHPPRRMVPTMKGDDTSPKSAVRSEGN